MANDAYLVAVKDDEGTPTGYYRCSLCNAEIRSNPQNPGDMAIVFAVHVGHAHRNPRGPIEDVSQTAARVVEEAIRMLPNR